MEVSNQLVSSSKFYLITLIYEFFMLICLVKVIINYLAELPFKSFPLAKIMFTFWSCNILLIFCVSLFFLPGLSYQKRWDGPFTFFFDGLDRLIHFLFLTAIFLCLFLMDQALLFLNNANTDAQIRPNWASWKKLMIAPLVTLAFNSTWPIWAWVKYNYYENSFTFKETNYEKAPFLPGFIIYNSAADKIFIGLAHVSGFLSILIYIFFILRSIPALNEIYKGYKQQSKSKGLKMQKFRLKEWSFFLFFIFFIGAFKTIHSFLALSMYCKFGVSKWLGFESRFSPSAADILFRIQNPDIRFYFLDIHSLMNAVQFGLMSFVLAFLAPSRKFKYFDKSE